MTGVKPVTRTYSLRLAAFGSVEKRTARLVEIGCTRCMSMYPQCATGLDIGNAEFVVAVQPV